MRITTEVQKHPVSQALTPKPGFLKANQLPLWLNPFLQHYGINMFAVTLVGFPHLKIIPALQMMLEDYQNGLYDDTHTIVVPSSGNTAHAIARFALAFGLKVKAVLATDVISSKKLILEALSTVEVISVSRGDSVADRALEEAERPGHILLNQYGHEGNVRAHQLYTGPEIVRCLSNALSVIAISMGSGGTITGVGKYLKERSPGTLVLGVRTKLGEQVPGARDKKKMAEVVTLDWQSATDAVAEVSRKDSFRSTRRLWSGVEPQPGPTSGMAYHGLVQHLSNRGKEWLEQHRGTNVAFICPDGCGPYLQLMLSELDPDEGLV